MSGTWPLYSTQAARALDQRATHALGGDAYVLMQRAGQVAWQHVLQHWPEAQRIVVVCGPGSNGGDGYVLARHAHRAGRSVDVVHLRSHVPGNPVAQRACTEYVAAGGRVALFEAVLPHADLVVDALFGIGLSRAPESEARALIEAINEAGIRRFIAKPWKDYELIAAIGQSLALHAAARENQTLADEMRLARGQLTAEELERRRLEAEEPGITRVNWGPDGSVLLDESLLDSGQKFD